MMVGQRLSNRFDKNLAMRNIVHLDADAFFASVEQATDARLRGKPPDAARILLRAALRHSDVVLEEALV